MPTMPPPTMATSTREIAIEAMETREWWRCGPNTVTCRVEPFGQPPANQIPRPSAHRVTQQRLRYHSGRARALVPRTVLASWSTHTFPMSYLQPRYAGTSFQRPSRQLSLLAVTIAVPQVGQRVQAQARDADGTGEQPQAARRPRPVLGHAVAKHRPRSRRPIDCRRRKRRAAERVLLRRRRRRRLEDHRLRRDVAAGQRHALPDLIGRARSPSRRRIRTWCTPAWASPASAATSSRATASTRRPMPARPGRMPVSAAPKSSARFASIRRIPTSCTRPCSGIRTTHIPIAGSIARRMAPRPGRRCCFATIAPARSTCRWIRRIPTCCTPRSGRCIARRGRWKAAGLAAGCSSRPTAARPGPRSRRTPGCRRDSGAGSACRCRAPTAIASTPSSRTTTAACFVSDDAGATWRKTNEDRNLRQRAFYYTHITADTVDKDTVYVLNVQFFKSTDGGQDVPEQSTDPRAARRQPRPVDFPHRQQADGAGQRRRRQRFGERWSDLVRSGICDRAVLQRLHDASRAVSRVRRAAGQQHGVRRQPEQPGRGRGKPAADLLRRRRR